MSWFTDIPKFVVAFSLILSMIWTLAFYISIDFKNPGDISENSDNLAEFLTDSVVPTEFNWISWLVDKLSNHPFLLLGSIVVVFWLFGYFLPKEA